MTNQTHIEREISEELTISLSDHAFLLCLVLQWQIHKIEEYQSKGLFLQKCTFSFSYSDKRHEPHVSDGRW